jgi:hypothetical protein
MQFHLGELAALALAATCEVSTGHFATVNAQRAARVTHLPALEKVRLAPSIVRAALVITAAVTALALLAAPLAVHPGLAQLVRSCGQGHAHTNRSRDVNC